MRRPSSRMYPHTVTIVHNVFDADQDGGAKVGSSYSSIGIQCFVQPGQARTIVDTSDTTGESRTTEFIPTKIYFIDNVNIKALDLIQWIDSSGTLRIYQVVGYTAPAAPLAQWRAECQEKI